MYIYVYVNYSYTLYLYVYINYIRAHMWICRPRKTVCLYWTVKGTESGQEGGHGGKKTNAQTYSI
jgi:hypothetical protein